jgi:hypothetical protein
LFAAILFALATLPGSASALDTPVLRDVQISASTSSARYKELGPAGGTLTVQLVGRGHVTLTLPPGALFGPTLIGLDPITAIRNLPADKALTAAVRIKPDGLLLARPASLEFAPAKTVPADKQWGATALGDGRNFHAVPLRLTKEPTLLVDDFAVYSLLEAVDGAGDQTTGSGSSASPAAPSRSADLVGEKTTETLQALRARGAIETTPEVRHVRAEADLSSLNELVRPLAASADQSDADFIAAQTAYMTSLRQRLLLGETEAEVTQVATEIGEQLEVPRRHFLERAIADCKAGTGGRGAATRRLIGVVRQLLLMGIYTEETLPPEVQTALENCEAEAKYELEVTGAVHQRTLKPKRNYVVTTVDGTFHMKKRFSGHFTNGALSFAADVRVTWRAASAKAMKDCKADFATTRTKLYLRLNIVYDGRGDAAHVRLFIVPHATPSEVSWSCPDIEGRVKRGFWLGPELFWDQASQRDFELAGENADLATSGTALGDSGGLQFSSSARIRLRRLDSPSP